MSKYKHVLLATDLAENSDQVANQALLLAKQWKAKLSSVHVIDYGPLMYGGGEFAVPLDSDVTTDLIKEAKAKLKTQGSKTGIDKADQWVLHGQTKEEIITLAKKIKADLVIVGGHDKRWLSLLFGSTANAILHSMPCDVLTVRLEEHESKQDD